MSTWQKPPLGAQPIIKVPGLIADWVMNEGSGSRIYDSSGNGHTGALVSDTAWVTGRTGPALAFPTPSDWVAVPKNSYDMGIRQHATFCAWTKSGDISDTHQTIVSDWNSSIGFNLYLATTSVIFYVYPNNHRATAASTIVANTWHFISAVMDGANIFIYVDAVLGGSVSLGEDIGDSAANIHIGIRGDEGSATRHLGEIELVSIYNRALTPGELQQLYLDSFWYFPHDPIELWAAATATPPTPPAGNIGKISTRISLSEFLGAARFAPTTHNQEGATGTTPTFVPPFVAGGLSSKGSPLSIPANSFLGGVDERWDLADVWFDRAIVRPQAIDFGNIISTQNVTIDVYTSHRSQVISLNSVVNNLGIGSSISGTPTLPLIMQPQSGFSVTLTIDLDGPPIINDTIDWHFSVSTEYVTVEGTRIVLFPIRPAAPFREHLLFETRILTATDGSEQRSSSRKMPRGMVEMTILDKRRLQEAFLMDRQSKIVAVPAWHEPSFVSSAVSVSDTTVNVGTTNYANFYVGGLAILFTDQFTFDAMRIESMTSTSLTFDTEIGKAYIVGTQVMPLMLGYFNHSVAASKKLYNDQTFNLRINTLAIDNDIASAAAFGTYLGKVLLDEPNMVNGGQLSEVFGRDVIVLDNVTGLFEEFSHWDRSKRRSLKGFKVRSRQQLWELRQLLHHLRGRQISFYLPTFTKDLLPNTTLLNGTATFPMDHIGYVLHVRERDPKVYFRMLLKDGTEITRSIISSEKTSDSEEILTLDDVWASDIEPEDIERVDFLEKVRMDADDIVITHFNAIGEANCFIPTTEVFD